MLRLNVREMATGRWSGILAALGVDPSYLTGKHVACPVCGGKDRFRFDDKAGRGTYFCSHCGAGDGFTLLGNLKGWNFATTAREVEQLAGIAVATSPAPTFSEEDKLKALRRVWAEAKALQPGDEAMCYLVRRGLNLDPPPFALRLHPGLTYRDGADVLGRFPGLLALVTGPDGRGVTLHRTYLNDGRKAPVPSPRKLMPGKQIKGSAIRLHLAGDVLGIAEGIETALAACQLFYVPVWSCLSAAGIESFVPPAGVRKLIVFGDNDVSGTGQAAAWSLAKRLIVAGIEVEVRLPKRIDTDWADEVAIPGTLTEPYSERERTNEK
jgi:putative DNA primase/helicase